MACKTVKIVQQKMMIHRDWERELDLLWFCRSQATEKQNVSGCELKIC